MNWLFGFEGRINRAKYALSFLMYVIPFTIGSIIADHVSAAAGAAILLPVAFMMAMPAAKRLHDLDHSGWWQLLGLVPLVNIGLGIYLLFWKGTNGENRFGSDPLGGSGNATSIPAPSSSTSTYHASAHPSPASPNTHPSTPSSFTPSTVPSIPARTALNQSSTSTIEVDENAIYATVANELETGQTDKGLWTRLYVENDGDEKKTKLAYIKQRAEILIADEMGKVQDQLHHYEEKTTRVRELTKILASNTKIRDAVLHLVDYVKGNPGCDTNLKIELVRLLGGAFSWDEGVFTSACTVHLYEQEHKFVKSKDFELWIVGDVVPLIDVAISSADIAK